MPSIITLDGRKRADPVTLYLMSKDSERSRKTLLGVLKLATKRIGISDPREADWSSLTKEAVMAIKEQMRQEGASENYINLTLSALRGVAKEAFDAKLLPADELERIKNVSNIKFTRVLGSRLIDSAEIGELIDYCLGLGSNIGKRDAAIFAVLFGCGARRAELVGITLSDVDLDHACIRVTGKGNKQRELEVPDRTDQLIRRWLSVRGNEPGYLFSPCYSSGRIDTRRGISNVNVYRIATSRMEEAGLKPAAPHEFRRGFITHMLNQGVDIGTTANLAGHASVNTTRIYDRGQKKRNQEAIKRMSF